MTRLLAIAALVSASLQFLSELGAKDKEGMIITGLGGAGALLSLAGFLGFAGTVLGGSVVGIPIGVALQVLGATIGIVTTILTTIRSATTPGVFLFIDGVLDELDVPNSPFRQVAISRPELQAALDDLRGNMDDSHFWFIEGADKDGKSSPNLELLADYGLAVQHTMHMVGEDKFFVKARLPPAKTVDLDHPPKKND